MLAISLDEGCCHGLMVQNVHQHCLNILKIFDGSNDVIFHCCKTICAPGYADTEGHPVREDGVHVLDEVRIHRVRGEDVEDAEAVRGADVLHHVPEVIHYLIHPSGTPN